MSTITPMMIDTSGIQPMGGLGSQNDSIGGRMYITELDQGTKKLKGYSDRIKKTKDINEAELEQFMN